VWGRAAWSGVVMHTIDAGDGMGALVEGVFPSGGTTVITRQQQVGLQVRHVVRGYLDGGNGVGKIPP
jgi:hypothetical protein